jgi:threonine aldolase
MMINLISDTVTKPTKNMLKAMFMAEVGDDVFREDPTITQLEQKCAEMFGMEAALYCPSGTMTNQIALKIHTQPMDEVICDELSHIYQYEVAGYAFNSGIGVNLLRCKYGILVPNLIEKAIKPRQDWLPISRLVVIENTTNKGGGAVYSLEQMQAVQAVCQKNGLILHCDGARIFNALNEMKCSTQAVGACLDSISICLSKGLGAPVGSVLIGRKDFIAQARRLRKAMGGGMRQAGYLAAAGIYALDHHVARLEEDHQNTRKIGKILQKLTYVSDVLPVTTNIVIFDLVDSVTPPQFLTYLKENGVLASAFGGQSIRFVLHLEISAAMVRRTIEVLKGFGK